jgi:adsorption protein B
MGLQEQSHSSGALMLAYADRFGAVLRALSAVEHELLVFAAVWLAIGALDELAVDAVWLRLVLTGRGRARWLAAGPADGPPAPLRGVAAVLVPAWHEAEVVGAMLTHTLSAWPQRDLRIYAGCYRNDPQTLAAMIAAAGDPRLRIVVHAADGPTTKADCLNRLYAALCEDERRARFRARSVLLHDAEDMVHPAALGALDTALDHADFAQVPVRPEPQPRSRWIAGHYADEFAEAHARAMVVRDWLGIGLPSAGVGSAFSRDAIDLLAARHDSRLPFAAECLTEDYECGLLIGELGARARFLRLRGPDGDLVATRAYFPADLGAAIRQKTRWLHGIAFQGWDRLGWNGGGLELWMRMRDRRGPMIAVVLAVAYMLMLLWPVLWLGEWLRLVEPAPYGWLLRALLAFNLGNLVWRVVMRFTFTAREYGWREGVLAVFRVHVSNAIAIIAGRRALFAYVRALRGGVVRWDKTTHTLHPALQRALAGSSG